MNLKDIRTKFLVFLALFAVPITAIAATDVQNYDELTTAITNKEADISVTNNIADFGDTINIDYTTAISSSVAGTIRTISNPTNQTLLFNIAENTGNLTLTDIALNQVAATGSARIIENAGTLNAVNSAFSGAKSTALVNSLTGTMVLTNATMNGNTSDTLGGAIGNIGTLNISNSSLSNNSVTAENSLGGAMYSYAVSTTSSGNNFKSNNAAYGGAIYNKSQLTSTNDTFLKNTASIEGGAIYNTSAGVTFSNASFGDGTDDNANSAVNGGAIANTGTIILKNNTTFNKNTATANGGAIYNSEVVDAQAGTSFVSNSANNGGAVYNVAGGTFTLASSTVNANAAKQNGGAVYNSGTYTSSDTNYSSNTAVQNGGAVYNDENAVVTLKGGSFKKNSAVYGGSIYNSTTEAETPNLIIDGVTFGDNDNKNSAISGGAIYNTGLLNIKNTTATENVTTFNGNSVIKSDNPTIYDGKGGAIANTGYILVEQGTSFSNNNAELSGGAIANVGTVMFTKGATFENNESFIGGAISNIAIKATTEGEQDLIGQMTIANNSTFVNNKANYDGGAISNDAIMILGNDINFSGNQAIGGGGAIANVGVLQFGSGINFTNNTANSVGGAIYSTSGLTEVKNATFTGNKSNSEGGAVAFSNYDVSTPQTSAGFSTNTSFVNNTAKNDGGAIYNNVASTITSVSNTTFNGNKAGYSTTGVANTKGVGGAISNYGQIGLIDNSSFVNNSSTKFGGAIANMANLYKVMKETEVAESNIAAITGNTFNGNTSVSGGAIYNENTLSNIANNDFTANKASEYGGAIYNNKNTYQISQTSSHQTDGVMIIKDSTFGDGTKDNANIANNGGAIANTGTLTIKGNTTFNGNYAKTNGGAIYNTNELYLTPAEGETITFKNNLSNYDETTNTGNSNAIYNSGKISLNGAGTVLIQDSVNGNGTLEKTGTGDFNVVSLDTTNPFIEQNAINFYKGNVNINGSASEYAEVRANSLNMTAGKLNLLGNAQIDADVNTLTPDEITAVGSNNAISGQNVIIAGLEEKPLPITVGDGTTLSDLSITPSNSGSAIINKYVNMVVKSNGTLILDATDGNIIFESENINGYSVNLQSDAGLTISGKTGNSVALNNVVTSVDDTAKLSIIGTIVYDMDLDFSGAAGTYYQSGATVNVNNKFFVAKAGSQIANNSTFKLNEGAEISTDGLSVNNSTIIFNKNSKQAVESAKLGTSTGNVVYGGHSIALNQANLVLNDGYVITPSSEDDVTGKIEVGTGTNALKSLTLQDSTVATGTDFNLVNGSVVFADGSKIADDTTISIDSLSYLNITNTDATDTLYLGSDISGTGTINKSDSGDVQLAGDSSGFTGTYNQANGLTEFLAGSTYFGDGFTHNIAGGEVKFNEGVNFVNTTPVEFTVNNSNLIVETVASTADLSTQKVKIDPKNVITMNLVNSGLAINKYANVTASTGLITIGDDGSGSNTRFTNLSLGDTNYTVDNKLVTFAPTQDTDIIIQNPNNIQNVGSLTFGDNAVTTLSATGYDISTQLGKNTSVNLNISANAPMNNKLLNLGLQTEETAYAQDNGKLIKGKNGAVILSGDNSKFHGTVQVNNGSLLLNNANSAIAADSQYDLSFAESGANITLSPIHNTSANADMKIIGVNLSNTAIANVSNDGGSIAVTGNTKVDNDSVLTINSSNNVGLSDFAIGSASDSSKGAVTINAPTVTFNNTVAPVLIKGADSSLTLNGNSTIAQDLTIQHGTINLNGNMFVGGNFQMGSTVNMINNQINTQNIAGNMTLTENSDYKIDINGLTLQSDKVVVAGNISATTAGTKLDISDVNLIFEPKYQYTSYQVFNDSKTALGQPMDSNVVFNSSAGIIDGVVGKYALLSGGNGSYTLSRIGYNPYVLGGQVAAQAGYYTQLNSYNMAFANSDMITALPRKEREAYLYANKYAEAVPPVTSEETASDTETDVKINEKTVFEPSLLPENNVGGWFRPYGIFENVKLKEGPEVGNNMYGTYFGADSKIVELKHGVKASIGMYAGYDGSHQTFEGVGIYQNGGTIGSTASLYKGDFFNLTTANLGASGAEQSSIYGHDNFWLLRGGIANKTGYNWDLFDGKFIIQPHLLMSISSVNLFSYKASHIANIDGESLFTYQLAPGFKFIGNLENGWQPYFNVDMIWNIGGKSHDKANGIALPEMYSEPWIEYGLGMQKRWGERFTGYGQAMFRNIGRNGVAFSAGMRLRVGEGR